ncbi:MAG: hypothetical protein AAF411_00055 [Myxococcota bacterium]
MLVFNAPAFLSTCAALVLAIPVNFFFGGTAHGYLISAGVALVLCGAFLRLLGLPGRFFWLVPDWAVGTYVAYHGLGDAGASTGAIVATTVTLAMVGLFATLTFAPMTDEELDAMEHEEAEAGHALPVPAQAANRRAEGLHAWG